MKIVLDTNVFISGIFFSGPPFQVLEAWRDGKIQLVISPAILEEYQRVAAELAERFPGTDLSAILELVTINSELVLTDDLPDAVCDDPDDDKFLACALASGSKIIVSGDRHLLTVSGYRGIEVIKPRKLIEEYVAKPSQRS
jgi:putative PIN family toxin of toxin-antitoxin system